MNKPEDFDMWIPNTAAERSFDGISGFEVLAFGTLSTSYHCEVLRQLDFQEKFVQLVYRLLMQATPLVLVMMY